MRIMAGLYKGRVLASPPGGSEARPITGLAKKSLFDILRDRLVDATVLDLYCGTGTIGLEALSRGAARCYFADRDGRVLHYLRQNIDMLQARESCVIWRGDVESRLTGWLSSVTGEAHVAFVDPPYAHVRRWDWTAIADRIFVPLSGRLAADAVVVLRVPPRQEVPEQIGPLKVFRSRRQGGTELVLLSLA